MIDKLVSESITDWYRYFTLHEDQSLRAYYLASVTNINQAALDIFRAPSQQHAIDMTFVDTIPPDELLDFKNTLIAFIEGRMSNQVESKELTYDDVEISTRRSVAIPPGHRESWSRVLFTIEDMTESKRMEVSLRESEEWYQEMFDDAPAALWIEDWSHIKKMVDNGVENLRSYLMQRPARVAEAYYLIELQQVRNANLKLYGAESIQQYVDSIRSDLVLP